MDDIESVDTSCHDGGQHDDDGSLIFSCHHRRILGATSGTERTKGSHKAYGKMKFHRYVIP